jgi:hypothetical protein
LAKRGESVGGGWERRRGALVSVVCVAEGRRSWRQCGGGKGGITVGREKARGKGLERLVSERKKIQPGRGRLFG